MDKFDFDTLRRQAEIGDANAMYDLARALRDGKGCEVNIEQHLFWLNKLSDLGHPDALIDLSLYYSSGHHGLPRDTARKITLLERVVRENAAKFPHRKRSVTHAKAFLAESLYIERRQSDLGSHVELLRQAADDGYDYAQEGYGLCLIFGADTQRDIPLGMAYLRKAAASRERTRQMLALRRLGGLYLFDGSYNIKKDENDFSYIEMTDVPGMAEYLAQNPGDAAPAAKVEPAPVVVPPPTPTLAPPPVMNGEEAEARLAAMVGLDAVKAQIRTLINRRKLDSLRGEHGLLEGTGNLHLVFTGNPGTGKTTVARILGAILHNAGVLEKGHVVEVSDFDLIGRYVGEATPRILSHVQEAMGGILFIDEAYNMLTSVGREGVQHSGSMNAITTLLQQMEKYAGRFMVVAAGYPEQMQDFLSFNPGLKSRFREVLHFENYTSPELVEIYERLAQEKQYALAEGCGGVLASIMNDAPAQHAKHFGNARFVHNLFEETLERVANRVVKLEKPLRDDLVTITAFDIQSAAEDFRRQDKRGRLA